MHDEYDPLVFYDALSAEEQASVQEELAGDPDRAKAFKQWRAVRSELRERLHERVPNRRVLVLYALDQAGRADLLAGDEQATLEEERANLERALGAHPGLVDVVRRIERGANDFEAVWEEHLEEAEAASRRAPDRAPSGPTPRSRGVRWRRWASRGAVGLAVVAFVALLALLLQRDQSMVTVTAADGQTRLVELGDGSTVRLAGGATLTYPDPGKETVFARHAKLKGRAFFDVAHKKQRFTIETPTALATVLGTSFALDARKTVTTLTGVAGRVRFANRETQKRAVIVEGGQRSRVARNALPSTPTSVDVSKALGWTHLFLFRSTSVAHITERLSAFYDVTITAAAPLASKKVTGTFEQDRPAREVLQVLAATLQADVQEQPDGSYRLVPAA